MRSLDLSGTKVADAAAFANLTNLRELNLSGTQVADAAPLAKLINLQKLDLSDTQVAQEQISQLTQVFAKHGNSSVEIINSSGSSEEDYFYCVYAGAC